MLNNSDIYQILRIGSICFFRTFKNPIFPTSFKKHNFKLSALLEDEPCTAVPMKLLSEPVVTLPPQSLPKKLSPHSFTR